VLGERIDFVLDASTAPKSYKIKVQSTCSALEQTAVLQYIEAPDKTKIKREIHPRALAVPSGQLLDSAGHECGTPDDEIICLGELEPLDPVHSSLSKAKVDIKLELPFDFSTVTNHSLSSFIGKSIFLY
jgi:hypothetical protein